MSSEADEIRNQQADWISPDGRNIISITADKINHAQVIQKVSCPTSGAVSTFIGTTRDSFEGNIAHMLLPLLLGNNGTEKTVVSLEYEAYGEMALSEMKTICNKVH
jgi:molybdopterin synthase catalytic subunit